MMDGSSLWIKSCFFCSSEAFSQRYSAAIARSGGSVMPEVFIPLLVKLEVCH